MTVRFYSSVAAETTLVGSIASGNTSIQVASVTGFPAAFPYTLALDYETLSEELVQVESAAGTNLTITRAIDGTSATSHSGGARVRHVSSARDFADSRAHENTGTGVHGVTGTIVGTSGAQTLSNKTLTNPTINAASLTGTFAGTPTFSGNVAFTGEIAHSNLFRGTRATTSDSQWETRVTGDANARFFVRADGAHRWGPGTTIADSTFERIAANLFRSDSAIRVERTNSSDNGFMVRRSSDTGEKLRVTADGTILWGDGAGAYPYIMSNTGSELAWTANVNLTGNLNVFGAVSATTLGTVSGTPTAQTGWNLVSSNIVKSAGVVTWVANMTRTGADIVAGADGNISPDNPVLALPSTWRPAAASLAVVSVTGSYSATNTSGACVINGAGIVSIIDANSNSTISTGNTLRLAYTYVTDAT